MPRLFLASNKIGLTPFGHLQLVQENDGLLTEIEVQAPITQNGVLTVIDSRWIIHPVDRVHQENTGESDRYNREEIVLDSDRNVSDVWELLSNARDSLSIANSIDGIEYRLNTVTDFQGMQNSNSYINTLMHIAGLDVEDYIDEATPSSVFSHPGVNRNVLFNRVDTLGRPMDPVDLNILGTSGNDTIQGGAGNDTIVALGGDNLLRTFGGNNTLISGYGDDTLIGGTGDDSLTGRGGNNTFIPGSGNDTITGGDGDDTFIIREGFGNNVIRAGGGNNTLQIEGQPEIEFLGVTIGGDDFTIDLLSGERLTLEDYYARDADGDLIPGPGYIENITVNGFVPGGLTLFPEPPADDTPVEDPQPDPSPTPPSDPTPPPPSGPDVSESPSESAFRMAQIFPDDAPPNVLTFLVVRSGEGPLELDEVFMSTLSPPGAPQYPDDYELYSVNGVLIEDLPSQGNRPADVQLLFDSNNSRAVQFQIQVNYEGAEDRSIDAIILQDRLVDSTTEGVVARLDDISLLPDTTQTDDQDTDDEDLDDIADSDQEAPEIDPSPEENDDADEGPIAQVLNFEFSGGQRAFVAGQSASVTVEIRLLDDADLSDEPRFNLVLTQSNESIRLPPFRLERIDGSDPSIRSTEYSFAIPEEYAGAPFLVRLEAVEDDTVIGTPTSTSAFARVAETVADDTSDDTDEGSEDDPSNQDPEANGTVDEAIGTPVTEDETEAPQLPDGPLDDQTDPEDTVGQDDQIDLAEEATAEDHATEDTSTEGVDAPALEDDLFDESEEEQPQENEIMPDPDSGEPLVFDDRLEDSIYTQVFFAYGFDEDGVPDIGVDFFLDAPPDRDTGAQVLFDDQDGFFDDYLDLFAQNSGEFQLVESVFLYQDNEDGNLEEVLRLDAPEGGFQSMEQVLLSYLEATENVDQSENGTGSEEAGLPESPPSDDTDENNLVEDEDRTVSEGSDMPMELGAFAFIALFLMFIVG
ncbi:calcium-binding protein [Roseinatronobacter sp.]|uniref:calcium-binding protein n=1 Tax=Roseinatronobacter sp. TaxID=1945755 RepID=UPI0025F21A3B|nr:hypothetical protein [Roseibaca sp.]